jgi:CTP:molybdopterin cytidylyltransferase MocA
MTSTEAGPSTAGLLLAAGAGRRMGRPKALLRDRRGVPFLDRAVGMLLEAGCGTVTVVLGAAADEARLLLDEAGWSTDPAVAVVVAEDWEEGMGASLRRGLTALHEEPADAALVLLVDLPDVHEGVLRRVLEAARSAPEPGRALVRATYGGRPGHPVLLGRAHWPGVVATARGDQGAREYLTAHPPEPCECADLAAGRDVDRPEDLSP